MRNLSLLGVVLLVHGVFGGEVKSVSVMVGDSVTLQTDLTETKGFDELQWEIQGENNIIAEIDREAKTISVPGNEEERFRDRLKLDHQTGFLTITNIRTTDSGDYQLKIKSSNNVEQYRFSVTVRDVFVVDTDGVKSVSVTEGDTVTLHTGVTPIQKDDQILWKFGDQDLNSADDTRWRNIDQNDQTRDLNIKNIRRDQSGDYELEINTSSMILHRKLRINISGVFSVDGVKKMPVTEGDPVTLQTRITNIPEDDVIEWTFGPQNTPVVKTDRENRILLYNEHDIRFTNRLHLDSQSGDLTISNTHTEASGLYQLKIIKTTYSLQKSFRVIVGGSDRSGAVSGISGASVGLMVWAVTVFLLQEV